MLAHLLTDGPVPLQYLELVLCRDLYHCTPSALDEVDYDTILAHLACIETEARVKKLRERK